VSISFHTTRRSSCGNYSPADAADEYDTGRVLNNSSLVSALRSPASLTFTFSLLQRQDLCNHRVFRESKSFPPPR